MTRSVEAQLERFKTALIELDGFADRNVKRAKTALHEARRASSCAYAHDPAVEEAKIRLHDAERFYLVIHERVKEAFHE